MTDSYTYIPIFGKYVVVAPGVCGGRPTLIGTRLTTEQIATFATRDGVDAVATSYGFIAKDGEVVTSLLPPPRPDLPESVANHGDELLHSLQSLAKEMIRDAR